MTAWTFGAGCATTSYAKINGTSLTCVSAITASAGNFIVIAVAMDNTGTSTPTATLSKPAGETNSYTYYSQGTTQSAAGAGVTITIATMRCSTAWSSFTPVATISESVAAASMTWLRFAGGSDTMRGTTLGLTGTGSQTLTFTGAQSPQTGDLQVVLAYGEDNAAMAGGTDTGGSTWPRTNNFSTGGGAASNVVVQIAYAITGSTTGFTAAGDRTYTNTIPGDGGIFGFNLSSTDPAPTGGAQFSGSGSLTGVKSDIATWQRQTDMPAAVLNTAAAEDSGKVYIPSGQVGGVGTTSLRIYTIGTDSWSSGTAMTSPARELHSACAISGNVYVAGGRDVATLSNQTAVLKYNIAGNSWTTQGTALPASKLSAAGAVINGKWYLTGGSGSADLWIYDPVADSWDTTKASMPAARSYHGCAALDGKLYVAGGTSPTATYNEELWCYDPVGNSWSVLASMPDPYAAGTSNAGKTYASLLAADGLLWSVGGSLSTGGDPTDDVWVYDPVANSWSTSGSYFADYPEPNRQHVAVSYGNNLYVFGGWSTAAGSKVFRSIFKAAPKSGSVSLAGSGTLTCSGSIPPASGSVALAGSGSLTVPTRIVGLAGSVSLAGAGSLSLAAVVGVTSSCALAGSGSLVLTAASLLLPPANLTATPVSPTQINLAWDAATGATGYDIERDSVIIVNNQSGTTYSDTGLTQGQTYSYRVRSVKIE